MQNLTLTVVQNDSYANFRGIYTDYQDNREYKRGTEPEIR